MNRDPHTTIRIRSEADVLALVPYTFGFHPEDSLVVLSPGEDGRPFQARVDLPDTPSDFGTVAELLVEPVLRNGGPHLLLVAYSEDECVAEAAAAVVVHAFEEAGVRVVLQIRADGSRWYPLGDVTDFRSVEGVPYDLQVHELTSRSVLDGRVTYRNRDELRESLEATDWELVDRVSEAWAQLDALPEATDGLAAEAVWLVSRITGLVEASGGPAPEDGVASGDPARVPAPIEADITAVARILRDLGHLKLRDAVWSQITHANATQFVTVLRDVVRASPEELLAPAAGLLAFASWLSGDGALASCAVERSLCADPDHALARLVGKALDAAMPPSQWRPMDTGAALLAG